VTTVVGVISGCGSLGASLGQLVIGVLAKYGWNTAFGALTTVVTCSGIVSLLTWIKSSRKQGQKGAEYNLVSKRRMINA
jgi:sugar phosphate permease